MIISPFTSDILSPLFADADTSHLFGDAGMAEAMMKVEVALASACADCGLISAAAAARIGKAAATPPPLGKLGQAAAKNGPPVAALADFLRRKANTPDAHFGVTSQDIIDTAFVLQLKPYLHAADKNINSLVRRLAALARKHESTPMLGRTRGQPAAVITFGLKVSQWALPLAMQRVRLREMRPRLFIAQLGGAAGTRDAFGGKGREVCRKFAANLKLSAAPPWHARRDNMAELANWLAMTTAMLAKIGGDIKMLAQPEIGEFIITDGGASSAMPHKNNPVAAETLQSLSGHTAALLPQMVLAMMHTHERDGSAWQQEWLALPALLSATAGAIRIAGGMMNSMRPVPSEMHANIEKNNGRIFAAAYLRQLSSELPQARAAALIETALKKCGKRHLADVLAELSGVRLDWQRMKEPAAHIGEARQLTRSILRACNTRN